MTSKARTLFTESGRHLWSSPVQCPAHSTVSCRSDQVAQGFIHLGLENAKDGDCTTFLGARYYRSVIRSLQSHLFSRLNKTSSFNFSSVQTLQLPDLLSCSALGLFNMINIFLYQGAQNWMWFSIWGLTSAEEGRMFVNHFP